MSAPTRRPYEGVRTITVNPPEWPQTLQNFAASSVRLVPIPAGPGQAPRYVTAPRLVHARSQRPASAAALTDREHQVLCGMAEGRSNGDIARKLYLSEDTIKTHARRLFRKLDARDRAHAVARGYQLGIFTVPTEGGDA